MKRLAIAALVLALGMSSALPAVADPGVFADGYQMAEADWIVMKGRDKATFYFVAGMRSVSADGLVTYGVVGAGDCRVERGKHWMMIICSGSGRGKKLSLEQFDFDPALRSAALRMRSEGALNVARWSGRGRVPFMSGGAFGGDGIAGVDVMTARVARIKARLLGHEMSGSRMSFAYLMQGATAAAYDVGSRSFEFAPDGSYRYDVRLRIPR